MISNEELKLVEEHIAIRLEPFIYAFSTNTIPAYLKVGDTLRGVEKRIAEWKKIICKNLHRTDVELRERYRHSALLSKDPDSKEKDTYFRDYAVHQYLTSIGKKQIEEDLRSLYSQEFFADTSAEDVDAAIKAIEADFRSEDLAKAYTYYSVKDSKSATVHGTNDKDWRLRPNQEKVVKNFVAKKDQPELLMYAVMRFGKSFTAMYCAKEIKAKKVLIVSAKADVVGEWQKTVETPKCFKDYKFLTDKDLVGGTKISDVLAEAENRKVALFLTLQNLTGKVETDETSELVSEGKEPSAKTVKDRLRQVFNEEFDLVIVDETHYGAWANSYGEPLKDADEDVIKAERKDYKNFGEQVARLHTKHKLHLSGTPYNLLYDNKFTNENIIATCQFKDILRDKEKWDEDHLRQIENGAINPDTGHSYQEFDNPYFGFPQMLRFAFNLPAETREKLQKAKYNWSLNDLFETKVQNGIATFVHEADVLKLLKAIDGAEDVDGILSFLDIPKIKENDVCKHMVFVLPRKYACDAMEQLLLDHSVDFHNLCKFKNILNITGHNLKPGLDSVEKVKTKISACEQAKEKTITLTVYKMLTGVTVKEWDTMFMFKNTHSAQEYDQAIFRIQNQYVEENVASDGTVLKIDKKPQTILVDFDPVRMFTFQGLSSRIVDNVEAGEQSLDEAIQEELKYFPIISYNADKLVKVEPTDLIQLITEYNSNKGIIDSVQSVEFDKGLLEQKGLLEYIKAQSPTTTKNRLDTDAHKGKQTSDVQPTEETNGETDDGAKDADNGNSGGGDINAQTDEEIDKDLEKKYRMCIARLSFYAFLTPTNIDDLQDIIDSLKDDCQDHDVNQRIFDNLELQLSFVEDLKNYLSRYYAINVGDALKRANLLSKDNGLAPRDRALNAIKNFNRFSESEIVTPNHICDDMVGTIGKDVLIEILNRGEKILDIASKTGEFAFAVYNLLQGSVSDEVLRNGIYSIPTSGTAYEFTRRIYETLGLNVENITTPQNLTAYDLLDITKTVRRKKVLDLDKIKLILTQNIPFSTIKKGNEVKGGSEDMIKFGAVIGNPPYNVMDGGAQASSRPIYNEFVSIAKKISPDYLTMIMPSRWYAGGKGLDEFRSEMLDDTHISELHDFLHPEDVFPDTNNRGGICYLCWNKHFDNSTMGVKVITHNGKITFATSRPLRIDGQKIFIRNVQSAAIIKKVTAGDFVAFVRHISPRKPFGIESNIVKTALFNGVPDKCENPVLCLGKGQRYGYIDREHIKVHTDLIDVWKVFIARANNIGTELNDDNLNGILGKPGTICTEAYLVVGGHLGLDETSASNLIKYLKTKFARFLHSLAKASQDATSKTFKYVPLQDFTSQSDIDWSKSVTKIDEDAEKQYGLDINELDAQLYKKYALTPDEISFIESMIKPME